MIAALTELELKVLAALFESSAGNGHDFGFVEDCRSAVGAPRQLAGVVSSLVQKGVITVHEQVRTDSGAWTQTTWKLPVEEVAALIGRGGGQ